MSITLDPAGETSISKLEILTGLQCKIHAEQLSNVKARNTGYVHQEHLNIKQTTPDIQSKVVLHICDCKDSYIFLS